MPNTQRQPTYTRTGNNRASSRTTSTARVVALAAKLNFRSAPTTEASLAKARIKTSELSDVATHVYKRSPNNALKLFKAVLNRHISKKNAEDQVLELIRWGRTKGSAERQVVCIAFRQRRFNIFLIHGVSELKRSDSRAYMKDYFATGGDLASVAQWLRIAGGVIRKYQGEPSGTDGVIGWLEDRYEDVVSGGGALIDAFSQRLNDMVDAVENAGKTVADVVSEAASWTVEQVTDLVSGLIEATKTVADILVAAASLAMSVFQKYVKGLVLAGQSMGQIIQWAKDATLNFHVVKTLFELGKAIKDIINWTSISMIKSVIRSMIWAGKAVWKLVQDIHLYASAVLNKIIRSLIELGKTVNEIMIGIHHLGEKTIMNIVSAVIKAGGTVAEIINSAITLTTDTLKRVVHATYKVVKKVGEILVNVVTSTPSIIRTVLQALFAVGVTLTRAIVAITQEIGQEFQRGFFEGLLALGKVPLQILKAALKAGLAILGLAFAVFLEMWGGHRELTPEEIREARRVFGWSIELSRVKIAVASIPADVINWLNGERPFTTMYIINFSSRSTVDMGTLIHELTHVWQAVTSGPIYMSEALHSQYYGRGYAVTDADIANARGRLSNLEIEQQATVVERYWRGRWGGESIVWKKYQPLAGDVYTKKARGIRFSPFVPVNRRIGHEYVEIS